MKLELKHLAGYLPYGLKMYWEDNQNRPQTDWELKCDSVDFVLNNQNKPILRPLSDILDEEYQLLWSNETDFESIKQCVELDNEDFLNCIFSFYFWQDLFKNKFDIYGLIENGLAIDINTLEK